MLHRYGGQSITVDLHVDDRAACSFPDRDGGAPSEPGAGEGMIRRSRTGQIVVREPEAYLPCCE
jgi:hypothetical protein